MDGLVAKIALVQPPSGTLSVVEVCMNVLARSCLSTVVSHAEEDRTSTGTLYCVAWRAFAPQLPCTPADRGKRLGPSISPAGWQLATSQGARLQTGEKPARLQGSDARHSSIASSISGCLAFLQGLQVHTLTCMHVLDWRCEDTQGITDCSASAQRRLKRYTKKA